MIIPSATSVRRMKMPKGGEDGRQKDLFDTLAEVSFLSVFIISTTTTEEQITAVERALHCCNEILRISEGQ